MTDFDKITPNLLALPVEKPTTLAEILIQSLDEKESDDVRSN